MAKYNHDESLAQNAIRGVDITEPETEFHQAFEEVKAYLDSNPDQKDNLVETLEFNINGLQAESEDKDFDWSKCPATREVTNEVLGRILMDYTFKASYEDIIELDKYLVENLKKVRS